MTRDSKIATVGTNAPDMDSRESTSGKEPIAPPHVPTVVSTDPVVLTLADAERLRSKILDLASFAQSVGIPRVLVNVHGVSRLSAWEVFPQGTEEIRRVYPTDRAYGLREYSVGSCDVHIFTGDVGPDAIEGVAP